MTKRTARLLGSTLPFLAITALCAGHANAQSYTHSSAATVGYIQTSGWRGGVIVWTQKNNTPFGGCTQQPTHMWVDTNVVTEEFRKIDAVDPAYRQGARYVRDGVLLDFRRGRLFAESPRPQLARSAVRALPARA